MMELKADRPHPRNYPHTPTDHRHTDKHFRLVMTFLCSKVAVFNRRAHTDKRTDRRTDGRYQVHYLPRFAVDKNVDISGWPLYEIMLLLYYYNVLSL